MDVETVVYCDKKIFPGFPTTKGCQAYSVEPRSIAASSDFLFPCGALQRTGRPAVVLEGIESDFWLD